MPGYLYYLALNFKKSPATCVFTPKKNGLSQMKQQGIIQSSVISNNYIQTKVLIFVLSLVTQCFLLAEQQENDEAQRGNFILNHYNFCNHLIWLTDY